MLSRFLAISIFMTVFSFLESLTAEETSLLSPEEQPVEEVSSAGSSCGKMQHPMRIKTRHIEANGIGYSRGYTTIEGFFAPTKLLNDKWLPFVDLRGHIFNNGKWAVNGGLGIRYLDESRVLGANLYYDFRETVHQHYNQAALGFESLGRIWDFRVNGYLPFGNKQSGKFGDPKFSYFQGHTAYIYRRYEFAMKGVNAEAGYHLDKYRNIPMYIAAGPYYLEGRGKVAWGGQLRASADFTRYIKVEGNISYDNAFKFIYQGQIGFSLPFGPRRAIKQRTNNSCSREQALAARLVQRVDRFEIIPTDRKRHTTKAIDPLTGQPYVFWFVSNTSHSKGTFESPYTTLTQVQNASAPNDVIYVYAGDGTSAGMNEGIVLQDNQKFWGAGISQKLKTTLGSVLIPAPGLGHPLLDNTTAGMSTIRLASGNDVAGLLITSSNGSGMGISGSTIHDMYIHDNIVFNTQNGVGIFLSDCTGDTVISNNTISNTGTSDGIEVQYSSPTIASITIASNKLSRTHDAIAVINSSAGRLEYCISNNHVDTTSGSAIFVEDVAHSSNLCGTIEGNFCSGNSSNSIAIVHAGGSHQVKILNNTAKSSHSGFLADVTGGILCLVLQDNSDATGFTLNKTGGTFNVESSDSTLAKIERQNLGGRFNFSGVTPLFEGSCPICSYSCD